MSLDKLEKWLVSDNKGWVYIKDDFLCIEIRWDRKDQRVRIRDLNAAAIVDETGVSLSRVMRYYINSIKQLKGENNE